MRTGFPATMIDPRLAHYEVTAHLGSGGMALEAAHDKGIEHRDLTFHPRVQGRGPRPAAQLGRAGLPAIG